jgi:hypothetical protein
MHLNEVEVTELARAARSVRPQQWNELPAHEQAIERLKVRDVLQQLDAMGYQITRKAAR